MNDGKDFCDHKIDDPLCTCQLESMIRDRKRRERIKELFGTDLNTEAARREYYSNAYVYSLTNSLELLVEKYDQVCTELTWATNYIMGDTDDSTEQAGWRAFNLRKR